MSYITNQGIDIDYPIRKGNLGYFQQTFDTFNSERNKLINLMSTFEGERIMQPKFGLNIRKYLFEQITEVLESYLKAEITGKVGFWLPNIQINNMRVDMVSGVDKNTITISIDFSLKANSSEFDVITFTF